METLAILFLWVIPGLISIFITLKGLREERDKREDKLYNTIGDLGFAVMISLFGIVGLFASILVVYDKVIIKKFNKKL